MLRSVTKKHPPVKTGVYTSQVWITVHNNYTHHICNMIGVMKNRSLYKQRLTGVLDVVCANIKGIYTICSGASWWCHKILWLPSLKCENLKGLLLICRGRFVCHIPSQRTWHTYDWFDLVPSAVNIRMLSLNIDSKQFFGSDFGSLSCFLLLCVTTWANVIFKTKLNEVLNRFDALAVIVDECFWTVPDGLLTCSFAFI